MRTWVWEKLSASKWMDVWEERFHGNPNLVTTVIKGGKSIRLEVFCADPQEAERIRATFGGRVRELNDADWQAPVEAPPPLKIRDRLLVTQETDPERLAELASRNPSREIIRIPAEMAFGTGDHATTATCLRLLVDLARGRAPGWSCADLGCGTGLLAIAARKLGAGAVMACDFDPFAIEVTARNAARNGVAGIDARELDILKWQPREAYDVVLANIFSTVLIEAFPVIARVVRPGGELVLSGILASQAWGVFEAAARVGFGFPTVVRKGKWVTARGGWMNDLTA